MHWASFDTFLIEDDFWQDKMGKPFVNREFLTALVNHGRARDYRFFCPDCHHRQRFRRMLNDLPMGDGLRQRVHAPLQAHFLQEAGTQPPDVMHQGDFTYHMPYLIELRNRRFAGHPFPVTGVTHSLDRVWLHTRFIQLLLAHPRPGDTIVCTSQCAQQLLKNAFAHIHERFAAAFQAHLPQPPRLVHIPLGLSDAAFETVDRAAARRRLGLPPDQVVILSLARFSVRQKMDLAPLLETFQWLVQRPAFDRCRLVLAGAGDRTALDLVRRMVVRLGVEGRVTIEANLEHGRKTALLAAADLFVSLADNYQETFGLTLLEAMAQGLAVVCSDFDGYKDLVHDGRNGFRIPTVASAFSEPWESVKGLLDPSVLGYYHAQKIAVDLQELTAALTRLVGDAELRRTLGETGRQMAENYRWGNIIPWYDTMWQESVELSRRAPPPDDTASGLLTPPVLRCFDHYPTRRLTGEEEVVLGAYGRERFEQGFEPIVYEDSLALLDGGLLREMARCLADTPLTITEVTARMGAGPEGGGLAPPAIGLHLDWLIKHGLVVPAVPRKPGSQENI